MPKTYSVNPKKDKRGLTRQQAVFVEKAAEVGHLEAAKIAYPDATPKDAQVIASQNMNNPVLVHNISKLADLHGLTKDACIKTIRNGLDEESPKAYLKAAELGLKLHGELVDKTTILPIPVSKEQYIDLCKTFWGTKPT